MVETTQATVQQLFDIHQESFGLQWIAGQKNHHAPITPAMTKHLAGHFSLIHHYCIQVFSSGDITYLKGLNKDEYASTLKKFFSNPPAIIIITDNEKTPDIILATCQEKNIPLFSAKVTSSIVISDLQYYLTSTTSGSATLHGVYMEVVGAGILITGESSIGKSELALELISRGHRLIADDAPLFYKIPPDTLNGVCPQVLQDFLEVRGLGILNIRAMFGDDAINKNKYLKLIIELKTMSDKELRNIDRFGGNTSEQEILGIMVPKVTLPVAPGRNMAVLVENAARNQVLINRGYNASEDFQQKQSQHMQELDNQ
ncbi:MAG: HPr(Ser) kinase/phosphatase [Gammaproteobacteria bacterium]|nr:HPr(Ser) kinase/phosphatase [Gammaproteobacteria bacterium]